MKPATFLRYALSVLPSPVTVGSLLLIACMAAPGSLSSVSAAPSNAIDELQRLQQQGELTVRALRAWDRLPAHFMQVVRELSIEGIDLLSADRTQIEALANRGQTSGTGVLARRADDLLALSRYMATVAPTATISAGVPTQLNYRVVVRNLSGVPVPNPVIRDNGRILDNNQAVKTGGNQDNTLDVGETWTWTYQETVTATSGQLLVNTATVQGPDDANRDTDLGNNSGSTTVVATAPTYDLDISKTVTTMEVPDEPADVRDQVLDECNAWKAAKSGGYLGTEDHWEITSMPAGTVFDFKYDTRSVPDRYVVEYPIGNRVLDTGWRGAQSYVDRNPQLYPGGLAGSGRGEESGIFTKGPVDGFKVTVYGPEQGTVWSYQVRGNCP